MVDSEQTKLPTENQNNENNSPVLQEKKKKKSLIKYLINILIVLVVTVVAIIITFSNNFNEIIKQLSTANYLWILVALAFLLLSMLLRSLVLYCFARLYTRDYKFRQAMAVDQIGVFYNAVTPGASGGQVMQAYIYKKQGIHISSAVSMLATYSIIYQIVLIIYGLVAFALKYDAINQIKAFNTGINIGGNQIYLSVWALTIIGFLLNVGVIGIVLLMGYWKGFHHFITGPCIGLLSKMKIVKKPDKARESLLIQVENFKMEMRRLASNIPFTILIAVLFFALITVGFSIPYWVGKALGNQSQCASFWDCVLLGNYHQMITGIIPIPGAAGVSEYFFGELFHTSNQVPTAFNSFFFIQGVDDAATIAATSGLTSAAQLLWRSITFIVPLIFAGVVTAFYHVTPKETAEEHGTIPNRETFVSLQGETYEDRKTEMDTILETQRLTREAVLKKLRALSKKDETSKKKNSKKRQKDYHDVVISKDDSDEL